jgi:hypothetical protein
VTPNHEDNRTQERYAKHNYQQRQPEHGVENEFLALDEDDTVDPLARRKWRCAQQECAEDNGRRDTQKRQQKNRGLHRMLTSVF